VVFTFILVGYALIGVMKCVIAVCYVQVGGMSHSALEGMP
jgi:hypothetical protein